MESIPDSGVYVLVIPVRKACTLSAGALGRLELREGYYAYVGRAGRGLGARLARHTCRAGKRLHWHVDYLLERACVEEIWVFPLRAGECVLAARLEREGARREGLRSFGSSDCRCAGHLLYLGSVKPLPPGDSVMVITRPERAT
jgi:Uri superfamily endonuclease